MRVAFPNPRSGCKHKAWGGAKRNPRMTKDKKTKRAKRAIARKLRSTNHDLLSPALAGSFLVLPTILGFRLAPTPGSMLSPRFAGSIITTNN
jgi:hypothetical protein